MEKSRRPAETPGPGDTKNDASPSNKTALEQDDTPAIDSIAAPQDTYHNIYAATEKDRPSQALSDTEKGTGAENVQSADTIPEVGPKTEYVKGWKMHMLTAGIWISLFLSTLETTIVSTSLVSIADSLSGFEERNWVVTAYFLTYTGLRSLFFPSCFCFVLYPTPFLFFPNSPLAPLLMNSWLLFVP